MVQLDTFQIDGRVLSLLELSGGFDKYLTGRENVILTTEFLGFPDGYALEGMDQVKEFSEVAWASARHWPPPASCVCVP